MIVCENETESSDRASVRKGGRKGASFQAIMHQQFEFYQNFKLERHLEYFFNNFTKINEMALFLAVAEQLNK